MREADLFRQYAKEAIHESSKAKSENEKRALIDLACTWAKAAMAGERVWGSELYLAAARRGGATSLTRS
jgi:hypothetical protein